MSFLKKNEPVKLKAKDTIDLQSHVDEAVAEEKAIHDEVAAFVKDVNEIEATPDFPRWGERKLTFAGDSSNLSLFDPLYIPEVVTTRDGQARRIAAYRHIEGQLHTLSADGQRKYRWCRNDSRKLPLHKRRGFNFSRYSKLFADTGLFEEGVGDVVKQGDLVLMEISLDGWERMRALKNRLLDAYRGSSDSELFSAGQQHGIPTFKENFKTSVREFYT